GRRPGRGHGRSHGGGEGRRSGGDRRLGQHGPGRGAPASRGGLPRLLRHAGDDGAGGTGRAVHALPAGPSRRGSGGRGDRRPAERGVGRSREPAACPEGAAGVPAAGIELSWWTPTTTSFSSCGRSPASTAVCASSTT